MRYKIFLRMCTSMQVLSIIGLCVLGVVASETGLLSDGDRGKPHISAEVGVAELSPEGVRGGYAIPASGGSFPSSAHEPIGNLDSLTCTDTYGWACDEDNFNTALSVVFYDGPYGAGGSYLGTVGANQLREPAVGAMCGGNRNHGFSASYNLSSVFTDSNNHRIYAYGLNLGPTGDVNTQLGSRQISCPPAAPTVTLGAFNASTIMVGEVSTISYSTSGATSCTGSGLFTGARPTGNNVTLTTSSALGQGTYTQSITCTGPGGSATSQTRQLQVNRGTCGMSDGVPTPSRPNSNLCSSGLVTWTDTTAGDGDYNWSCSGQMCSAPFQASVGVCGSSNGIPTAVRPSTNLCSSGLVTWTDTTAGDGTFNWVCGSQSCSASLIGASINEPIGNVDGYTCNGGITGWACDKDTPNSAINVDAYNGPGFGIPLTPVSANLVGEPAIGTACGGGSSHRYVLPIPAWLKDGTNKSIYLYGINVGPTGSQNQQIGIQTINCAAIPSVTVPILTLPTATAVTRTDAVLGATISSNGGSPITNRGTCFGQFPNPSANCAFYSAESVTMTGRFWETRSNEFQCNTTYYFRGFADNAIAGRGYSPHATFTTAACVTGGNTPPTVYAGSNRTITLNTTTASPSGASASDAETPPGSLTLGWSFESSTNGDLASVMVGGSTLSPTFTGFDAQGTYTFRLSVTDEGGLSSSDTMTVTVNAAPTDCPTCGGGDSNIVDIDANSCTIATTGSTCTTNVTWDSVTGAVTTPRIYKDGVLFASSVSNLTGSNSGPLSYGPHTFDFRDGATNVLESITMNARCNVAGGYQWNAGLGHCEFTLVPPGTIGAADCEIANGSSSCFTGVNWHWSGAGTVSVRKDGVEFSSSPIGTNVQRELVGERLHGFRLYVNNVLQSSDFARSECSGSTPWNNGVCDGAALGNLSAGDCTILAGRMSCSVSVLWGVTGGSNYRVYQNGVQFSSVGSMPSPGMTRTLTNEGSNLFRFTANGNLVDSDTAIASCLQGTAWDGSKCEGEHAYNLSATNQPTVVGTLSRGRIVYFNANMQNSGTSDINTAFKNRFTYCWGAGCTPVSPIGGDVLHSSISSYETRSDTSDLFLLSNNGTLRIQYCVDFGDDISEGLENDNCQIASYSVSNSLNTSNLAAVETPSLVTGTLSQGSVITLRGAVRNVGTLHIDYPFSDNFTYCWGAACTPSSMIGTHISIPSLNRNITVVDTSAGLLLNNSGVLRVQHCVDSQEEIPETIESIADNCKIVDFNVGSIISVADLTATNVSPLNAAPTFANPASITFTGTIGNTGSGATTIGQPIWPDLEIDWGQGADCSVASRELITNAGGSWDAVNAGWNQVVSKTLITSASELRNGTHCYRFIVDQGGFVSESNDSNNAASPWYSFTISGIPQCSDGIDNDADGPIDMGDPDCTDPSDTDESIPTAAGIINVTGCNIQEGDSLCDIFVTWSQTGNPEVAIPGATPGAIAGTTGTNEVFAVGRNTHTVTLRDRITSVIYDTEIVIVDCDSGLTWNNSSNTCEVPQVVPTIDTFTVCTIAAPALCADTTGAIPLDVPINTPLTITWNTTPGSSVCSAMPVSAADFVTNNNSSGSDTVVASAATQSYQIGCTNGGGPAALSPVIQVTTTGGAEAPILTVIDNNGNPVRVVDAGESVRVTWDTGGTTLETACTLTGGGRSAADLSNGTGDSYTGTSAAFNVTGRTTFRMSCGGFVTTVTLEVIPREWNS